MSKKKDNMMRKLDNFKDKWISFNPSFVDRVKQIV